MGWYFELNLKCTILPEFVEFIKQRYLFDMDYAYKHKYKIIYDGLSKSFKDLIDIWINLDISSFYEYVFDESSSLFTCQIRKKVTSHTGDLWKEYKLFLKEIIVPISSFIHECNIESDDWDCRSEVYTDMELRGQRFILNDMVKSIEMYTLPTDSLLSMNVRKSVKGNIQIDAQIQRGENTYSFQTEAIYAGGHNIQRLHYRYIVKTSIPKTGASEISKEYSEKIKKMSKLEKLNKEIESYQVRIERTKEKIEVNSKLNDDEILNVLNSKEDSYKWPTWSEIVKRGANVNYDNDENVFNQKRKESIQSRIKLWKDMNIDSQKRYLIDYQKTINKLIAKRDSMV